MNKKPIKDPNLFAKSVFDNLLDKLDPEAAAEKEATKKPETKDPKKQAAGRKGGIKGGQSRAKNLTPEKLGAIAKQAAKARWAKD